MSSLADRIGLDWMLRAQASPSTNVNPMQANPMQANPAKLPSALNDALMIWSAKMLHEVDKSNNKLMALSDLARAVKTPASELRPFIEWAVAQSWLSKEDIDPYAETYKVKLTERGEELVRKYSKNF